MGNLFMNLQELTEEINIEFECLDITIESVIDLRIIIGDNEPDRFQKAAMNQFISEFYNGIENILKRICKYSQIQIPYGGDSHINLFNLFITNGNPFLPVIFKPENIDEFKNIRKFRHFVIHGYSSKIEWHYLKESIGRIDLLYNQVKQLVLDYLNSF